MPLPSFLLSSEFPASASSSSEPWSASPDTTSETEYREPGSDPSLALFSDQESLSNTISYQLHASSNSWRPQTLTAARALQANHDRLAQYRQEPRAQGHTGPATRPRSPQHYQRIPIYERPGRFERLVRRVKRAFGARPDLPGQRPSGNYQIVPLRPQAILNYTPLRNGMYDLPLEASSTAGSSVRTATPPPAYSEYDPFPDQTSRLDIDAALRTATPPPPYTIAGSSMPSGSRA